MEPYRPAALVARPEQPVFQASPQARPATGTDNADHVKAARQFEAMMLKQILTSAMPRMEGAGDSWMGLALEGVAEELANAMPFGLAQLLEKDK